MSKYAVVGDVVVFTGVRDEAFPLFDVTMGREYAIVGSECYYNEDADKEETLVFFIDDAGDENYAAGIDGDGIFEIVFES